MNRRRFIAYARFAGFFLIAVGGVTAIYTWNHTPSSRQPTQSTETSFDQEDEGRRGQRPGRQVAHLYFSDKDKPFLVAEQRMLIPSDDPVRYGKAIIEALISGPEQGLAPTLPGATDLRGLFITEPGVAYVDLTGNVIEAYPGGSETERMTVYSIVNSLVLNIPRIKTVKILIDGRESMTLAGHIDLRSPFRADLLLIR